MGGSRSVHYPALLRVLTNETISVNKPVFRLGKERSYVDYFVTNNNAVSRSHADIITRGRKYFVIDLNSKNHTYINDQIIAVHCETEIRNGDRLKLGNEEFIFRA
jgi:pSer/pThr/pTyr-binding forkhead associated (FHA) protein